MLDVFLPLSNIDTPPQIFSFRYADSKRKTEDGGSKQPQISDHLPSMAHLTTLQTPLEPAGATQGGRESVICSCVTVGRTCKLAGFHFYFKCIILHVYFLEIITINNSSISFIVCVYGLF